MLNHKLPLVIQSALSFITWIMLCQISFMPNDTIVIDAFLRLVSLITLSDRQTPAARSSGNSDNFYRIFYFKSFPWQRLLSKLTCK